MTTRLLSICHGFPPYYGGAETAAYYLSREAARTPGFEVRVLTSDIGGRLPPRERMDGMDVVRIRAPKRAWTRHTTLELGRFLLAARRALPGLVREWRPDFVFAHFGVPAGELARGLGRRWGIPYGVVLQGSDVPGYQARRFGLVYPVLRPVVRRVWREARCVVAVSGALRDLALATWPAGPITVIENGVDTEQFAPQAGRPAPGADAPLTAVVVAQWIERKGIQYLFEAVAGLPAAQRRRVRLHLYGSGPYEAALRSHVAALELAETVEFRGLCEHDRLPEVLRQADGFILPSLQEGLPLALLEALACGVPCVATRVGGIPTVVRDRENGWLVAPGDVAGLRAALAEWLGDAGLRARCAAAAPAAAAPYAWSRLWLRYRAAFGL